MTDARHDPFIIEHVVRYLFSVGELETFEALVHPKSHEPQNKYAGTLIPSRLRSADTTSKFYGLKVKRLDEGLPVLVKSSMQNSDLDSLLENQVMVYGLMLDPKGLYPTPWVLVADNILGKDGLVRKVNSDFESHGRILG